MKNIWNSLNDYLINSRPYSWLDLILLGFVAKFIVLPVLEFSLKDIIMVATLLCLWGFFNLALEARHNYSYRGKIKWQLPIIPLVVAIVISIFVNVYSIYFILFSTLFVLAYLLKNKNLYFGIFSSIFRGLIQAMYFLYAISLFGNVFSSTILFLAFTIFSLYFIRAIVGDIRDFKHNKKANKSTLPVIFGIKNTRVGVFIALLGISISVLYFFNSIFLIVPIVLFSFSILFYKCGYTLHQLMINVTTFFSINIIFYITSQDLVLVSLLFVAIYTNMLFYPLLKRKSNPLFEQ